MKRIAAIMLYFLTIVSVVSQVTDEESIRKNFDSYSTALVNQKGEEVATLVDSCTIHYYYDLADRIRDADSMNVSEF